MAAVTIPCPNCGKKHRAAGFEEASAKCLERAEKRAAREHAKDVDLARRETNWQREKPWEMVWRLRREGIVWANLMKPLNDNYEPPEPGRKWTLYDVVKMDSIRLVEAWGQDLEAITIVRLEKIMVGDFISLHPLAGGTLEPGEGGRDVQLEIPWTDQQLKDADKRRRADAKAAKAAAEAEAAKAAEQEEPWTTARSVQSSA